ncbi:thermonuclease family protein [Halococcus hamelinensis]|uniref:thermonuclease family protein n=1 Tax=Halococcus hamelinensis TaxID=332168 RepID=UPI00029B42A6|nr:thermonuclease family protein [Halococcus hamelinensis]
MKPTVPLVCLLVVLAGCSGLTGPTTSSGPVGSNDGTSWTVTVVEVVDGDTMDVRFANGTTDTVRLLGVDTPEVYGDNTPDEFEGVPETEAGADWLHAWGENASRFARDELDGRQVTVALDPAADTRGSYGRLLVYVSVDGQPFNRQLLVRGYARFYDAPLTRTDAFERAEARAQRNGTGLWGYEAA